MMAVGTGTFVLRLGRQSRRGIGWMRMGRIALLGVVINRRRSDKIHTAFTVLIIPCRARWAIRGLLFYCVRVIIRGIVIFNYFVVRSIVVIITVDWILINIRRWWWSQPCLEGRWLTVTTPLLWWGRSFSDNVIQWLHVVFAHVHLQTMRLLLLFNVQDELRQNLQEVCCQRWNVVSRSCPFWCMRGWIQTN